MGLELKSNVACRPDSGGTLPFYFSSGPRRLFAWLHLPASQARTGMGLVICAPFGYEAICAHRSLRSFAEQASELGIPAIRFDYAGTGDSEDLAPEADQLEAWANDILAAAEELRRRSGVTRIALLGIRLGALLAALATRTSQVDALIMIAPVLTGRRYLSEIRTTQLAASMARDAEADEEQPPEAPAKKSAAGQIEVSGFSMSAATTAALAACDLTRSEEALSPRRLIIDNERLPTSRVWAES